MSGSQKSTLYPLSRACFQKTMLFLLDLQWQCDIHHTNTSGKNSTHHSNIRLHFPGLDVCVVYNDGRPSVSHGIFSCETLQNSFNITNEIKVLRTVSYINAIRRWESHATAWMPYVKKDIFNHVKFVTIPDKYLCSGSIHVRLQDGLGHIGSRHCTKNSHQCSVWGRWGQWTAAACRKGR